MIKLFLQGDDLMKWTLLILCGCLAACSSGSSQPSLPQASSLVATPNDIGGPGVEINNQSCLNGVVAKGNCHQNRRFFKLAQLKAGVQYKNAGVKNNYFTTLVTYNHTYEPVIVTASGGVTSACPPQTRCPATGQAILPTPSKGIQIVYN